MRGQRWWVGVAVVVIVGVGGTLAVAGQIPSATGAAPQAVSPQLPLAPVVASGQTVTPVFEGWYRNPDGTFSLSFGYHNRNSAEVLEIPVGPDNSIEPGGPDRGQPARFEPRRHWGVFAVRVPADFGDGQVVWTLKVRGHTYEIPGSLRTEWEIDALQGEAGAGNTPPVLRFARDGTGPEAADPAGAAVAGAADPSAAREAVGEGHTAPAGGTAGAVEGAGPGGVTAGPLHAVAGEPVALTVHASDDGRPDTSIVSGGRENVPVTLTWFKHRGPGEVTFSEASARVEAAGGETTTMATFAAPGNYVVRVRANDASGVSGAGHAQCCWTNGFLEVTVAPGTGSEPAVPGAGSDSAVAGAGSAAVGATPAGVSPAASPEPVTFARDVAPIFQEKCQICHQPNSVAPMSLLTYRDARRWASTIKERVQDRVMPPWHINRTVGIQQFENDRGLSDEQIETIVRWVDAGAPMGDEADLPARMEFPDPNRWQLADRFGEPDLIVRSEPYTLAAETQDKWFRPVVETGLTEPRWVRAIEIKPSYPDGRRIVHHVLTWLEQEEEGITGLASTARETQRSPGLFMEWAVGKVGEVFPEDTGKLMLPGSRIRWEVHMHAVGEEIADNVVEMGIYFYPEGYAPPNRTVLSMFDARGPSSLDIPPNGIGVTQDFHVLQAPARLENFQPHMHMRGKAMAMEAVTPDGERTLLSYADNFQWNWHINYIYAEDAKPLLPEGTVIVITAWHDNTAANPSNPDPRQWVGWGDRTVDDMAHAWVDVTYLEQEYFDRLVAERAALTAEREGRDQQ